MARSGRPLLVMAWVVLAGVAWLAMAVGSSAEAAGLPLVVSTTVNYTNKTLVITGQNFGSSANVTLDSIYFPTKSSGSNQIVASFPNAEPPSSFAPGTYFLTVTFRNQPSTFFTVEIGATGPAGAQGPAGPQGAIGATGPVGPAGAAGAMGPVGMTGPQGPIGPMGATGATGPTGATGLQGTGLPAPGVCGSTTWGGATVALVVDPAVYYQGAWTCKSQLPRYVVNGDGTLTDNLTGLMWEMQTSACTGELTCDFAAYTWSSTGVLADGTLFTVFIAGLNGGTYYSPSAGQEVAADGPVGTCFAKHCDWRIPTEAELYSIDDISAPWCNEDVSSAPCIDPAFGPTIAAQYWSSTTYASSPNNARVVPFTTDQVARNNYKLDANQARAVRTVR